MKMDQEHIEEWMFDYFEGNLSEDGKSELLQFIHEHPEYEKDFAQWAQTYAHVEETVPNYGLASTLIQKPPFLLPLPKLVLGGVAFVGVVSILFFVTQKGEFNAKKESLEHSSPVTLPLKTDQVLENHTEKPMPSSLKTIKIKGSETPNPIKTEATKTSSQNLEINSNDIPGKIEQREADPNLTLEENVTPSVSKESSGMLEADGLSLKPDSVASHQKQASPTPVTRKKSKRKLPLNLTPSSDFMPVNDNF
jgi:hypothetical protein